MKKTSIDRYISLFENLSHGEIAEMEAYVSNCVYFKDPFNEVDDISGLKRILTKTLEDVDHPFFKVLKKITTDQGYLLKWHFQGHIPVIGLWEVTGWSELVVDVDGKISSHIDYWDASQAFYMKLPVIGFVLKKIMRRLQV